MPDTAIGAFNLFRSQFVDLDPDDVSGARRSREYLKSQILGIEENNSAFPRLYPSETFLSFGSFARRTKVRPLDDLDMLVVLNGNSGTQIYLSPYTYGITFTAFTSNFPLWSLCDGNGYISSTRVLNVFKSSLSTVPNYRSTPIVRNGSAVVVDLISYDWSFDIVPAFAVSDGYGGIGHYLIPNGSGNWMQTDPRRDRSSMTEANQYHNSNLVPLIRIMKYWNVYSHAAPRIGSYHLETMLLSGFRDSSPIESVRHSIPLAFSTIANLILQDCPDPKGLGPHLDSSIDWERRSTINAVARTKSAYAHAALSAESENNDEEAIRLWKLVFPNFPSYAD